MNEFGKLYRPARRVQSFEGAAQEFERIAKVINYPVPVLTEDPPNPGEGAVWIVVPPGVLRTRKGGVTYNLGGGGTSTPTGPTGPGGTGETLTADSQSLETAFNTPINFQLTGASSTGGTFAFVMVAPPAGGTLLLNADGSGTYTPNSGYFGLDVFTFKITNGVIDSAPAAVDIRVLDSGGDPTNPACIVVSDVLFNNITGTSGRNTLAVTVVFDQTTLVRVPSIPGGPVSNAVIPFDVRSQIAISGGGGVGALIDPTIVWWENAQLLTDPAVYTDATFKALGLSIPSALVLRFGISIWKRASPGSWTWSFTIKTTHPITGNICTYSPFAIIVAY